MEIATVRSANLTKRPGALSSMVKLETGYTAKYSVDALSLRKRGFMPESHNAFSFC
jgi:hypothetical protein